MPHCDLEEMKALAREGRADFRQDKALFAVANRLRRTPDEAADEILRLVQRLGPEHFREEGRGTPSPPCDVYAITESYWTDGRWDDIDWYMKLGVDPGPPSRLLWVESCHD